MEPPFQGRGKTPESGIATRRRCVSHTGHEFSYAEDHEVALRCACVGFCSVSLQHRVRLGLVVEEQARDGRAGVEAGTDMAAWRPQD